MMKLVLAVLVFFTMFLYGLDREGARQDWLEEGYSENCIFQSNCDYYNEK